jgi:threonyl-tRNA synthetase
VLPVQPGYSAGVRIRYLLKLFLSTRPPKRVGREEDWDAAETALEDTLKRSGIPYN